MSKLFKIYGKFCARHPWEVIVAVITTTICLLTIDKPKLIYKESNECNNCFEGQQSKAFDVIVMTIIRCLAILYSYHQFRNLHKLGSKYILGLAGLFIVFASFVFTTTVLNFLSIDLVDLKDALFFFLLLIDLPKAATLAQFALTASNQEEITSKIARGMSILGPTITLDTVVETLVIGVGTLSGFYRLEILSYFACLSVIVNYLIFMTFYPACLSLMLELSKISNFYGDNQPKVLKMLLEENDKSNPAIQRVKLIMSFGLTVVHIRSRWLLKDVHVNDQIKMEKIYSDCNDTDTFYSYFLKQMVSSADHIVILIVVIMLITKFIFFENNDNLILYDDHNDLNYINSMKQNNKLQQQQHNEEKQVQTVNEDEIVFESLDNCRNLEDCLQIYRSEGANKLNDKEIILLVDTKHIPYYNLEKILNNFERAVNIRRKIIENLIKTNDCFINLPFKYYDYSKVMGVCCENVIGYIPIPLGIAGPLLLDGKLYFIPMSTTEGCLVASTNRGCRAVEKNGIKSEIYYDGMSRAPVIRFQSISKSTQVKLWLKKNFNIIKIIFDSTSRFAKLKNIHSRIAGRYLFIRFIAETGDAMGMNMVSKGTEEVLKFLQKKFIDMEIISLSGNFCTDKKPAAINWIQGRGKSVVCEAIVPSTVISTILKTTSQALVDLNISKNFIGSAMAGTIGGFNAHAANIVTAIFLATGQDPAQNVTSSNCITIMETYGDKNQDLYISCTMPSIEIGTVGGGTNLPAQSSCLELLGVKGSSNNPGENAKQLAKIICATVLAGELSLMAALATGHLVKSHLKYNRSIISNNSNDDNNILCNK